MKGIKEYEKRINWIKIEREAIKAFLYFIIGLSIGRLNC